MKKDQTILSTLKEKGYRLTSARKAIAEAVLTQKKPFSALELHAFLKQKKIPVDKVTIYRELQLLEKEDFLQGAQFQDGIKRYCLASNGHHHHLICTNCSTVQDVKMENDLNRIEKKIRQEKSFQVQSHTLEFYGLCADCA